tara:strand:- start:61788 stop:62315 length:528 start_codon:yes stop_codon:yes gene_type:complete
MTIWALFLSTGLFSKETKDRALFRFDNEVVFLSEAKELIKYLDDFRCLKDDWLSLKVTKLTKKDYLHLPNLGFKKKSLSEERVFINRFIDLQKLKAFTKDQLVKIEDSELAAINKTSCFPKGHKTWPLEVQELVKLELYIKSRYVKDSDNSVEQTRRLNSFFTSIIRKSNETLFF